MIHFLMIARREAENLEMKLGVSHGISDFSDISRFR